MRGAIGGSFEKKASLPYSKGTTALLLSECLEDRRAPPFSARVPGTKVMHCARPPQKGGVSGMLAQRPSKASRFVPSFDSGRGGAALL